MASSDPQTGGAGALIAEIDSKNSALNNAQIKYDTGAVSLKAASFILGALDAFEDLKETSLEISKNITTVRENLIESGSAVMKILINHILIISCREELV